MAKKTIRDAVKNLQKEHAQLIIRAFNATGVIDLYNGDLSQYLLIIVQTLGKQREQINTMKSAATTVKGILEANF